MTSDPIFLIAIGGMALAVMVVAIFMRQKPDTAEDHSPLAAKMIAFEDDQARLWRYACPECGQMLRQEAYLTGDLPRAQKAASETGYPAGPVVCPGCGLRLRLDLGVETPG